MTGRTYSIVKGSGKSSKTVEVVLESGLTWEVADSRCNQIAAADRAENPLKSSWARDVFVVQMEPAAS